MANLESTIALVNTENSNLICMWCGKDTTGDKTKEHIFPECIGGRKRLPAGYVCANCNNHFSHRIDRALLKEHSTMMDAFQVDLRIQRKGKGEENKKRYQEERKQIHGIGEASSTRINRDGGSVHLINAGYEITSGDFVRSLHKCVANIICDLHGPMYVRKTCPDLLAFVQNGGDVRPWSYAVSYPALFDRILISEPRVINRCSIENGKKGTHGIISFIHTSGIWMVGSSPFLLGPDLIPK